MKTNIFSMFICHYDIAVKAKEEIHFKSDMANQRERLSGYQQSGYNLSK